jgi:2-polyprenyl-3-methyl-5-hydroxy-6-metoxy-1,4-benzoquinol methylase
MMTPDAVLARPLERPIVWKDVPCPLCSVRNEELLLTATGEPAETVYRLVRCRSCGLGYLNPRPDEASIGQFYREDYEPYQARPIRAPGWWGRWRNKLARQVLATRLGYPSVTETPWTRFLAAVLSPWLAPGRDSFTGVPYAGQGRLLDFGCGSGWYAWRMKQQGWDVVGMDFSQHAARQVTTHYGIPVHVGTLPHQAIQPESFDAITMGAVLEHVHSAHRLIEAAVKALRPGGMLAVSVPNLESWALRRFGTDSYTLQLPVHLLHFTPVTLRRLLEWHGLEVIEQRMMARAGWMRRTLRTSAGQPGADTGRRALRWIAACRPAVSLLTRWTVWKGQADCLYALARRPVRSTLPGWLSESATRFTLRESDCQRDGEKVRRGGTDLSLPSGCRESLPGPCQIPRGVADRHRRGESEPLCPPQ